MATYNYVTLAQAQTELGLRLFDPTFQHWTQAELTLYIQEALRTFQALTNFWRNDFIFPTIANQTWYDLTNPVAAPQNPSLRPITVTDQNIYTVMEYHLLEPVLTNFPAVGNVWTGSSQFSLADLINAVQRRRDEILSVTGCAITRRTLAAVPGRTVMPDTVLDIRRGAFLPAANFGSPSPLWVDDVWAEQAFESTWTTNPPGTPQVISVSSQPPLTFDVDTKPNVPGNYELLTIEAGGALSTAQASTLLIPDDWTWVVKWGALADLLSRESNAKDELRAKYCQQRFLHGLALLSSASALLAMRANNTPLQIDTVYSADAFHPSWQADSPTQPSMALTAGLNLIALTPTPDAPLPNPPGQYSITATVAQNAPIPVAQGDPVQVGRDEYDAVIQYAQHLAAFNMGGQEFMDTMPLVEHFLGAATIYNSKLAEYGEFIQAIYGQSAMQKRLNPEHLPAEETR